MGAVCRCEFCADSRRGCGDGVTEDEVDGDRVTRDDVTRGKWRRGLPNAMWGFKSKSVVGLLASCIWMVRYSAPVILSLTIHD